MCFCFLLQKFNGMFVFQWFSCQRAGLPGVEDDLVGPVVAPFFPQVRRERARERERERVSERERKRERVRERG